MPDTAAGAIVSDNCWVSIIPPDVAWTVNVCDSPPTVSGTPDSRPDDESVSPEGRAPCVTTHEYVPVPPTATNWIEYDCCSVPLVSDVVVMTTGLRWAILPGGLKA